MMMVLILYSMHQAQREMVHSMKRKIGLKWPKVWMIGVDKDQSLIFGDDVTLTSMVKRVDEAVQLVSKSMIEGKFEGGKTLVLGLKDNGVGLPEENPNLSKEVLDKVEEFKQKSLMVRLRFRCNRTVIVTDFHRNWVIESTGDDCSRYAKYYEALSWDYSKQWH